MYIWAENLTVYHSLWALLKSYFLFLLRSWQLVCSPYSKKGFISSLASKLPIFKLRKRYLIERILHIMLVNNTCGFTQSTKSQSRPVQCMVQIPIGMVLPWSMVSLFRAAFSRIDFGLTCGVSKAIALSIYSTQNLWSHKNKQLFVSYELQLIYYVNPTNSDLIKKQWLSFYSWIYHRKYKYRQSSFATALFSDCSQLPEC